ncbi:MAG: HupE/UreJ family protein [Burkholderiales bacterium]
MVFAAAFCLVPATTTFAHDPGLSALDVHVTATRIIATLSLAPPDAEAAARVEAGDVRQFALNAIEIQAGGVALAGTVHQGGSTAPAVTIEFERPPGSTLTVKSIVPGRLPRGHRQLLTVRDIDGRLLTERMLDARTDMVEIDLGSRQPSHRAARFAALGVAHILGGYDHLLFLAALLLGVQALGSVVKTVTAFTVAHSITLALAGLDLVHAPADIVEPLIAASIVFVGLENLVREPSGSRWKLTFAFGLVHGFGFGAALQELGLGGGGLAIVTALGSFNAGVEAGQIAVVVALWPLVRLFRSAESRRVRLIPACSIAIALAGLYWFVERTMF